MNQTLATVLIAASAAIAVLCLVQSMILKKAPSRLNNWLMAALEIVVLANAIANLVSVLMNNPAKANVFEYLGYLLVSLVIPAAAWVWAQIEKTRNAVTVQAIAAFTVAVMLVRMLQLWG